MNKNRKNINKSTNEHYSKRVSDYATTITILEHISDAIFILDINGKIQYANSSSLQLLRKKYNEIIGSYFTNYIENDFFVSKSERLINSGAFLEKIQKNINNDIETKFIFQDFQTPVILNFSLVKNNESEAQYIIVSAKDITIQNQISNEVNQQNLIYYSKDKLKSLGAQAIGLVHELAQPLAAVKLKLELLQKNSSDNQINSNKLKSNLSEIDKLIDNISLKVNNIRNFSQKIANDKPELVCISNSINDTVDQISYELTERNIKIVTFSHDELPNIFAIPIVVEQIFVSIFRSIFKSFEFQNKMNIDSESENKIFVVITDKDNKWIELEIFGSFGGSEINNISRAAKKLIRGTITKADKIAELSIIKYMIDLIGGDLKIFNMKNGTFGFMIRLPADQNEERSNLMNIIELFHKH